MRDVSIAAAGITPAGEHWESSLREMAVQAVQETLNHTNVKTLDAIIVGNALSGNLSGQNHLAPLIADYAGLRGVEAFRVEGADASGGLALRMGYLMVASGAAETVMVLGCEKVTDVVGSARVKASATTLDSEYESAQGATPTGVAAMLMRRYMHDYHVSVADFANFSVNAHGNGSKNPNAMYRNLIKAERFAGAPLVAEPINLFDVAPEADGAAALILTSAERAPDLTDIPVRILGSGVGTDTLAVHERPDPLFLSAAKLAADRAYRQANLSPSDIDLFELHDSATIMAALALEASGFAARGEGWKFASENRITLTGDLPISTFGGLKSRGNPLGATGIYQAAEIVLQLRGEAGPNQVKDARIAMAQNLGGVGGTAVTHIFGR